MTKSDLSLEELDAAERIALAYATGTTKAGFAGVFLLDHALQKAALGGREPVLAQIKLAWWRDEIARLTDNRVSRPHPVLQHLAWHWPANPSTLTALVDAWEELGVGTVTVAGAEQIAGARAEALQVFAPIDARRSCRAAARCWSLVELAALAREPSTRDAMLEAAAAIEPVRLPAAMRPLAVLDGLARRALKRGGTALIGDRLSPLAAMRLGIFGR